MPRNLHLPLYAALFGLAAPVATWAQDGAPGSLPDGFYIDGYIEYSELSSDGFSGNLAGIELDLGVRNLFGAFGFSLGIDGFDADGNTNHVFYPAVTYNYGDHQVSVGMTRSVLDNGYLPDRKALNSSYADLEFSIVSHSLMKTYLLFSGSSNIDNIGLRWDGVFGDTRVGVSYNNLSLSGSSGKVDSFALALRHELADFGSLTDAVFFAGIESYQSEGEASMNSWRLGVEGEINRFKLGAMHSDSNEGSFPGLTSIWADFEINDRFTIGADIAHLSDGGSSETYSGVSASYNVWKGLHLDLSVVDFGSGGNNLTEFSVRYQF